MVMGKVISLSFLLLLIVCVSGQDVIEDPLSEVNGPSEDCLRCICHARSGCFFMRNCANYSIDKLYWARAGRPTVLDDDPDEEASYFNCIKDDGCIMRAMRGYLASMPERDCNCDGVIDCKDYAAIHLKGDQCRSEFNSHQLKRLDKCLQDRRQTFTSGWDLRCDLPSAQ